MRAEAASEFMAALQAHGVAACVGGGWAVDALVGKQTRPHEDLDIWVDAADTEALFAAVVDQGLDRIYPWPGDRPWNFVLHDGESRRVDLHMYELLANGRLHYGSVTAPFVFTERDLSGRGQIAGIPVRCERPEFALQNRTGYKARDTDRHDVAVLCGHFGIQLPHSYRE
jgi:lincosamide nucleotidyltransferase A/C/D/E